MKKPSMPKTEEKRLSALKLLKILDTACEERFDRLTQLASRMFDVPIALVSLVDENRQWFKSCAGLSAQETSREISFCGHAILGDDVFVINDAAKDIRFMDNPLVTNEPNIRFYAGCPLKSIDGHNLGTLCIIDKKPRHLSENDLLNLKDLAKLVEQELTAVELATVDELTQIANRRGFVALAQKGVDICIRQNVPASLVFLDLDNFKPINDQHGHMAGDKVLTNLSNHMKNVFRTSDFIGRIGGDEFAILLTDATFEAAVASMERLQSVLNEDNDKCCLQHEISFSYGVVNVELHDNPDIESLLKKADTLMYQNKRTVAQSA